MFQTSYIIFPVLCLHIKVTDCRDLSTDNIVKTIGRVGVDEAIPDPATSFHALNLKKKSITLRPKPRLPSHISYFSEISVTNSNASSIPSSPIPLTPARSSACW